MREAPETRDHPVMTARETDRARHMAREQAHAEFLVRDRFAVHQRHQQKLLLRLRQADKPILVERSMRQRQPQIVPGESLGRIAIEIARNLIEQEDRRAGDRPIAEEGVRRL